MSSDKKYFSVDARTILQLGRDSIKEYTTALVELVKNCYDADSQNVHIEIYMDQGKGKIRVVDDGFGMNEEIIDENWLRIGFSEKKKKKVSQLNRRKTGEKGIGRIAADRLGKKLTLLTASKADRPQGLKVNWELFDVDNKDVHEVPITVIANPKPKLVNKKNYGTEIIIEELRNQWALEDIEKLYSELTTLTSPFTDDNSFSIFLDTDVDPRFKNIKVESTFNDAAEIELRVEYDGTQKRLTYYLENRRYPGEEFIETIPINRLITKSKSKKDNNQLKCGPFQIRLLFFLRDASILERTNYSKLSQFREILDQNLGVKLYRDNIAVKPYGYVDSEYGDWLGLASRKAKDPAGVGRESYKLTPNQLVGAVFIGRDINQDLTDSAGREGLVENNAFTDLRNVVLGSIQVLESHRVEINKKERNKKSKKGRSEATKKVPKSEKLDDINSELNSASELLSNAILKAEGIENEEVRSHISDSQVIIKDVGREINETIIEMLNERRTMNGLATLGITTAVFGHETESSISLLKQASYNAQEHLSFDPPDIKKSQKELLKVKKYSKQVGNWGSFALSRVAIDKRVNPVPRRIHNIIRDVIEEIIPMVEGSDIKIEKDIVDKVYSKVYPLDLEAILFNLITNAYQACLQVNTERDIKVRLFREDNNEVKGYCIQVEDNGPGIAPEFMDRIWEPLFSTKIGSKNEKASGTGLGLTIIESIVNELGGNAIAENSRSMNGAKFTIWLPKK